MSRAGKDRQKGKSLLEVHRRRKELGAVGASVMYLDSDNWLKGSVEFENEAFQHLGSIATNNGYSDWATTASSRISLGTCQHGASNKKGPKCSPRNASARRRERF